MPILSAARAASGSSCVGWSPWGRGGRFSEATAGGIFGMMESQLTPSSNCKERRGGPPADFTGQSLACGLFTKVTQR